VQPIVGRERETGVLAELIGRVHERCAALVVRGEAGIGKSALLASASVRARSHGMLILTTTGVQAESHLPFAGLHQLLRPLLGEVGELPDPQRDALLTAFGMTSAPALDLFLIALAALDLLAGAAARAPLLLIADDAQWLDRSAGNVLAFVA
jgi:predicted ATPase